MEGSLDPEATGRSKEDEVKMLGVGVAKRLEKVRKYRDRLKSVQIF